MLKPPTSTVVEKVPDAEIAKCSSWLEAFRALISHTASLSSTALEAFYNFTQWLILTYWSAVVQGKIMRWRPRWTYPKNKLYCSGGTAYVRWLCNDGDWTLYAFAHAVPSHCPRFSRSWPSPKRQGQICGDVDRRQWPFWSGCSQGRRWKKDPATESVMLIATAVKLALFISLWTELFPDNLEIIRKISEGILIAFWDDYPTLLHCPQQRPQLHSNDKASDLHQAVHKLLESHAIEEVSDPSLSGYYSQLFLVPEPDGTFCPIIILKKLNLSLVVPSFKMETLFSIIAALQPQEWITKIDLKDTYHDITTSGNQVRDIGKDLSIQSASRLGYWRHQEISLKHWLR